MVGVQNLCSRLVEEQSRLSLIVVFDSDFIPSKHPKYFDLEYIDRGCVSVSALYYEDREIQEHE